ncbi:MAG: Integral rane protein TerC, partial [Pedosphaera sp.]|nr:Integral rane protein TerC [Pedosphaera sp.]
MLALVEITPWHWVGFILCVLIFLALDLGVFHREAHIVKFKEAMAWTALWVTLALLFAAALVPLRGKNEALAFFTGYFIELSLSMDNVFVIALIFTYFKVPVQYQHRVLFWGILGALLMRGLMIWLGVELITRFSWLLYIFGGFLILTGIKMLLSKEDEVHPEKNLIIRAAKRLFPISSQFDGQKFLTQSVVQSGGQTVARKMLTPLFLVLVMVETTDL